MPTREQFAYLAGIIDGEGAIQIGNAGLTVTVRMMRREVPEWISNTFQSGTLNVVGDGVISWCAGGIEAGPLLEGMLPFLVLKKRRAEIALAYISTLQTKGVKLEMKIVLVRKKLFSMMASENAVKTEALKK